MTSSSCGEVEHGAEAVGEPAPAVLGAGALGQDARPARHRLGAQLGGDAHGTGQQLDPRAAVAVADQRGLVLVPRVEDVARARLDDDGQPVVGERLRGARGLGGRVVGEGVEVRLVEGEGDTVVAEPGDHRAGVGEAVAGEAVAAVAEAQAALSRGAHVGLQRRDRAR